MHENDINRLKLPTARSRRKVRKAAFFEGKLLRSLCAEWGNVPARQLPCVSGCRLMRDEGAMTFARFHQSQSNNRFNWSTQKPDIFFTKASRSLISWTRWKNISPTKAASFFVESDLRFAVCSTHSYQQLSVQTIAMKNLNKNVFLCFFFVVRITKSTRIVCQRNRIVHKCKTSGVRSQRAQTLLSMRWRR